MQNDVPAAHDTSVGGNGGESIDQTDPFHDWVVDPVATHRVVLPHDTCWSELGVANAAGFAATDQVEVSAAAGGTATKQDANANVVGSANRQYRWPLRVPFGTTEEHASHVTSSPRS